MPPSPPSPPVETVSLPVRKGKAAYPKPIKNVDIFAMLALPFSSSSSSSPSKHARPSSSSPGFWSSLIYGHSSSSSSSSPKSPLPPPKSKTPQPPKLQPPSSPAPLHPHSRTQVTLALAEGRQLRVLKSRPRSSQRGKQSGGGAGPAEWEVFQDLVLPNIGEWTHPGQSLASSF